jgi:exonuclease III
MTFNIFYGGDELDLDNFNWCMNPEGNQETFEQVLETIRASDADVVGLQEGCLNVKRIADMLGWYSCERLQIISRFPLIDPSGGNGLYIFVEPLQGRVAALSNVHLPADPYGPYEVRDGATLEEVIELEVTLRLQASHESPAIQTHMQMLPQLVSEGIPVFLTGDFNSPSHLDWTEEVAEVRDVARYPVEWPVAKGLAEAGFRDSYREIYPDPIVNPGFTWTPGSPEGVVNEVHDRIDWVLAAEQSTTLDSQLMGEPDNPDVSIVVDPWPSDHRAVVSTFEVGLGPMPLLVAVDQRRLEVGDNLGVRFHASGMLGEQIAIVPAGGSPDEAVASQPTGGAVDGTLMFPTDSILPSAYEAALVSDQGEKIASIPFWLYEQGAKTTVTTSKRVYTSGEVIVVSWTNAPGYFGDWLGLYRGDSKSNSEVMEIVYAGYGGGNMRYLSYEYTHGAIEGTATFSESSLPGYGAWPLQPGSYEIRLLLDDVYGLAGSSMQFRAVKG